MNKRDFKRALNSITPLKLDNEIFVRSYSTGATKYSSHSYLFSCEWSFIRGYRYNYKGCFPTLYLAADDLTAAMEIGPRTHREIFSGVKTVVKEPRLYFDVSVTAEVLDLTDEKTRKQLGVTKNELLISTKDWQEKMDAGTRAVTHKIGDLVYEDTRFDGILYPPYPIEQYLGMQEKRNLALFMDIHSEENAEPRDRHVKLTLHDPEGFLRKAGLKT